MPTIVSREARDELRQSRLTADGLAGRLARGDAGLVDNTPPPLNDAQAERADLQGRVEEYSALRDNNATARQNGEGVIVGVYQGNPLPASDVRRFINVSNTHVLFAVTSGIVDDRLTWTVVHLADEDIADLIPAAIAQEG